MKHRRVITDPVEQIIATALVDAGILFVHESENNQTTRQLDFLLPGVIQDDDVFIECKRFHTPRIGDQMSRVENVIIIQGMKAAKKFRNLLGVRAA